MLIFTGVATEITAQSTNHMMVFTSPRIPGSHYKVETDEGTAARMRALIDAEVRALMVAGPPCQHDDEDSSRDAPFDRR